MSTENQYDHPMWKERRLEVLELDRDQCKRCGSQNKLEVHHLVYHRGREIWEYDDTELVTLCHTCHQEAHYYKDEINRSLSAQMKFWSYGIDDSYYNTMQIVRYFESMKAEEISSVLQLCASMVFEREIF